MELTGTLLQYKIAPLSFTFTDNSIVTFREFVYPEFKYGQRTFSAACRRVIGPLRIVAKVPLERQWQQLEMQERQSVKQ